MQFHSDLARLRRAPLPQPRTDHALAEWRASPEVARLIGALTAFAQGAALADCPDLAPLLHDHARAQALVSGLVAPLVEALRAEPLAQLPLGHSSAPGVARLQLACHGGAALSLAAYAPRPRETPQAAVFDDAQAHEIVVAGTGSALVHRLDASGLASAGTMLAPGTRLVCEGADTARQIITVSRPLSVLQLIRVPQRPRPSRAIALIDGRVLKTVSGCNRTSQQIMALGVLGALRHQGAAAAMVPVAADRAADRDLRWEALRQCLSLDAARGLAVLGRVAHDPADPLAAPAAALRDQLVAARPDLAALMGEVA